MSPRYARISVVIAWVNDWALLKPALEALRRQSGGPPHEIIVATRRDAADVEARRHAFPEVTLVHAGPSATIPMLRSLGLRQATGDVAAVTEDHCVPCDGWLAAIDDRMRDGCAVVGGPVENDGNERLRDWAAFLTEYAGAIGPGRDGPTGGLPGNNVAYRRELIGGLCRTLDAGLWESFYHDELVRGGTTLTYDGRMLMRHRRPFDFVYFLGQRFHFCRSFAAMRRGQMSAAKRLVYGAGSALLPLLLWLRGLRTLIAKRRYVARYLLCTPMIVANLCVGAAGEMVGYVAGGGRSLERVE